MNLIDELTTLRDRLSFACMTVEADRLDAVIKHLAEPRRPTDHAIFRDPRVEFASIEVDDVYQRRALKQGEAVGLSIVVAATMLTMADHDVRIAIAQPGMKALYGAGMGDLLQVCGIELAR